MGLVGRLKSLRPPNATTLRTEEGLVGLEGEDVNEGSFWKLKKRVGVVEMIWRLRFPAILMDDLIESQQFRGYAKSY